MVNLSFLFRLDKDKDSLRGQKAFLNTTVAVYESQDKALMEFCTNEWIRIGKDHPELEQKYNVAAFSKSEVIEVTGCPEKQDEADT